MNAHEIIIRPIITEKTMRQNSEDNKISFEVAKGANKTTVAIAIEQIYVFKPVSVNIMNVRPKQLLNFLKEKTSAFSMMKINK